MEILIENCAATLASCQYAESAGAGRIELCSALSEGGTTPSAGLARQVTSRLHIPVYAIIRPRSGDFCYTSDEIEVMEADIRYLCGCGISGFATGVLRPDGTLDSDAHQRLIAAAKGRPMTLHRAFDRVRDRGEALEEAIRTGFERILTSGGAPTAPEGADEIRRLVEQADGRIGIMAGAGIRPDNVRQLVLSTGVTEIHGTLQRTFQSQMGYRHQGFAPQSHATIPEWDHSETDPAAIAQVRQALSSASAEAIL